MIKLFFVFLVSVHANNGQKTMNKNHFFNQMKGQGPGPKSYVPGEKHPDQSVSNKVVDSRSFDPCRGVDLSCNPDYCAGVVVTKGTDPSCQVVCRGTKPRTRACSNCDSQETQSCVEANGTTSTRQCMKSPSCFQPPPPPPPPMILCEDGVTRCPNGACQCAVNGGAQRFITSGPDYSCRCAGQGGGGGGNGLDGGGTPVGNMY